MVTPWVKNQSLTISEQLEKGIRWFDFRVSYEKGGIYLSHTYLMEHTLQSIMEEFDSYFKRKPDCPFIMINICVDFNDRVNQAVINPLVQEILSWYKSLCMERSTFDATIPLVENTTTRKILFYNSDATLSHPSIFPSDLMPTLYGWDTGSIEAFEERLLNINSFYSSQTQPFIYPNERMIIFDYSSTAPLCYTDKQQLQLMIQYKSFIKNKSPTILSGNYIEEWIDIFRA
jgi:hypothetical protein